MIIFKEEYLKPRRWPGRLDKKELWGEQTMITRRHLLGTAGAGAALAVSGLSLPTFTEAEAAGSYATMGTLPGKKPLIQLSDRPPNYEAPIEYLRTPITPNDQFYVRYHLADIPEVKAEGYKISGMSAR